MTRPDHPFARLAAKYGAQWERNIPLDGMVCWRGIWMPARIIDELARRDFTDEQEAFIERCRGHGSPFLTWRSEADVISSLGSRGRP